MLYLRITDNSAQAQAFSQYIKTLPFVEILDIESSDELSNDNLLVDLKKSFSEVKEHKTKPLKLLLTA